MTLREQQFYRLPSGSVAIVRTVEADLVELATLSPRTTVRFDRDAFDAKRSAGDIHRVEPVWYAIGGGGNRYASDPRASP